MDDNVLFFLCLTLSVAGWIATYYFNFSEKIIERKTIQLLNESGGDEESLIESPQYVRFVESWATGEWFASKGAISIGTLIAFVGSLFSIIENSWWTAIIIFFVSPFIAIMLILVLRKFSQLLCSLLFVGSIVTIIIHLI